MCCCKSFGLQHLKESDLLMQKAGTDRAQLHYFHLIVYSLIGSDEAESAAGGLLSHSCSYPFSDMKWPKIGTTQYSAGGSFSNSLSFVCGHSFCLHTTPGERGDGQCHSSSGLSHPPWAQWQWFWCDKHQELCEQQLRIRQQWWVQCVMEY